MERRKVMVIDEVLRQYKEITGHAVGVKQINRMLNRTTYVGKGRGEDRELYRLGDLVFVLSVGTARRVAIGLLHWKQSRQEQDDGRLSMSNGLRVGGDGDDGRERRQDPAGRELLSDVSRAGGQA